MRNFIKLPFMFLVAGLLGLSGCIDNTVSPEVTAIRNAQAALLQAKADYQAAWVAYREAVTAAQEIANTVATANAARDIAAAQNTLEEAALKHSKEMIALQTALDAQVGSDAAQYLASYTTAVEAVYTATADKLTLEKNLADDYLLLTTLHNIDGVAGNEAQTIATIKAHYERKLAEEKVLLSYDSLVLANLLAVQTDASASDAVRASTERAIDSLDNVIWDFNNQIAIAKENDLIADELVTSINKTIADYDQLTEDIATATANIADYNAGIPVTNKYIAWYTDLLTINTGAIGSYTTLVSTTKTTFNTERDVRIDKQAAYELALANWIVAGSPGSGTTHDALKGADGTTLTAGAIYDTAQQWTKYVDAWNDYQGALGSLAAVEGANDDYNTMLDSLMNGTEDFNGTNNMIHVFPTGNSVAGGGTYPDIDALVPAHPFPEDVNTTDPFLVHSLAWIASEVAKQQVIIDAKTLEQADTKAAYDAAVAALDAAVSAAKATDKIVKNLTAEKTAASTLKGHLTPILTALDGTASALQGAINDLNNRIAGHLSAIAGIELALVKNQADLDYLLGDIAAQEARIAEYEVRITELMEIAAYWKGLLDALI